MTAAPARIVPNGVRLEPGLLVSFQRFRRPTGDRLIGPAPPSLGALLVGLTPRGRLLVPLAEDEAFWIGLGLDNPVAALEFGLAVRLRGGRAVDALTGAPWDRSRHSMARLPGTPRLDHWRHTDGHGTAFAREPCVALEFRLRASILFGLVDYASFSARTGLPPPAQLDPDAGYKGWYLP